MRGNITGDNWYYAEADGRWAGPAKVSTIKMPSIGAGRFELLLEVVDAIELDILEGMSVSINGVMLKAIAGSPQFPKILRAEFSSQDIIPAMIWELRFEFPRVVSPAEQAKMQPRRPKLFSRLGFCHQRKIVADDLRQLAIRLRRVSIRAIS